MRRIKCRDQKDVIPSVVTTLSSMQKVPRDYSIHPTRITQLLPPVLELPSPRSHSRFQSQTPATPTTRASHRTRNTSDKYQPHSYQPPLPPVHATPPVRDSPSGRTRGSPRPWVRARCSGRRSSRYDGCRSCARCSAPWRTPATGRSAAPAPWRRESACQPTDQSGWAEGGGGCGRASFNDSLCK